MRPTAAAALAALMACHALAQDDPPESRDFVVAFLTADRPVRRGIPLGLFMDDVGSTLSSTEVDAGLLDENDLVDLLKADVAPESWKTPGTRLSCFEGRLAATNRRSVLDAVGAWLDASRARHGRRVAVDASLVLVRSAEEVSGAGKVLASFRLVTRSGETAAGQRIRQVSYLRDHDVQVGTGATALDPIIDALSSGARIDVRPWVEPAGDGVLLDFTAELSSLESMDERALKLLRQEPAAGPPPPGAGTPAVEAKPWEARVQLPKIAFDALRGQVRARAGETVVAGFASRPDGVLALLLRPSFVDAAPDVEKPATRIYEVGAITEGVQDWTPPTPQLVRPASGAGPLSGATFTLDEPRVGYGLERLVDDVRAVAGGVAPTSGGAVRVRSGYAAAEKVLAEAFRRETRTVTTEAALVEFRAGAKEAWSKRVPALAPGGERAPDAEVASLIEEARKGGDVRLAGSIAVSGRVGQSVYALSGGQRAYVQDFEPQVGTSTAQGDPIIGVLVTGLGLWAKPEPRAGDGSWSLGLRAWSVTGGIADEAAASTGLGPVQRAWLEGPRWDLDVVCVPRHWTLAALEGRDGEHRALFVRVKD